MPIAPVEFGLGRVRATEDLTRDIRLITIEPPAPVRAVEPGSHIDVLVQIDEKPATRSYSLVGQPVEGAVRIAVKLLADTRGGSAYMWTLAPGARLQVSTPKNRFSLSLARPDYLLVAGGIGITPIYGMALALAAAGGSFRLLYAVRTSADLALADSLRPALGEKLQTFVDAEDARIDLAAEVAKLAAGGELYICGPVGMLEAAKQVWHEAGRSPEALRFETFGNSGHWATTPFAVTIPRLGVTIDVPRNVTLLDALERAGVGVMSGCRRGECGLCALPILGSEAAIDHRDVFFSDDEKRSNAKLCACVSRATGGTLTLDTGDRSGAL